MDTGDGATTNGNGKHVPEPGSPTSADAVPSGAPVPPAQSAGEAGAPVEPLVVIDKDPPPPPPELSRKQLAFLSAFAQGLTRTGACRAAKISKQTLYNWLHDESPKGVLFRAGFEVSYEEGTHSLIDEAKRRAVDGWLEPKFHEGRKVGSIRKYDSTLLIFLIKQRDHSFRDRFEVTGAGGAPLNPAKVEHLHKLDLSLFSDDELDDYTRLVSALASRGGTGTLPGTN